MALLLLHDIKFALAYFAHVLRTGGSLPRLREVLCRCFQSVDYTQADVLCHQSPEELWQESHLSHDVDRLSTHTGPFRATASCAVSLH